VAVDDAEATEQGFVERSIEGCDERAGIVEAKEPSWLDPAKDIVANEDIPERRIVLEDFLTGFAGDVLQVGAQDAGLDDMARFADGEEDFAGVSISHVLLLEDFERDGMTMVSVETGGHVVVVNEEFVKWMRHFILRNEDGGFCDLGPKIFGGDFFEGFVWGHGHCGFRIGCMRYV